MAPGSTWTASRRELRTSPRAATTRWPSTASEPTATSSAATRPTRSTPIYLRLESDFRGHATPYCAQTKPTSVAGCTAKLSVSDLSLAFGEWTATDLPRDASLGSGSTFGIYIFTRGVGIGPSSSSATTPFGTLCLSGFKRSAPLCSPAVLSSAQAGPCNSGVMSTAVNCNGGALGISVDEDVNVQRWCRDPIAGGGANAHFSNPIFYTVQ